MNFAWKFMLPMTLINILVAAIWHFMATGFARWAVCLGLVLACYYALGQGLFTHRHWAKRVYKYAE
jgi:NADH-quinone oxidoreductase subunit H